MGGLRKYMPITAGTFIVGWLAIAGVFPLAGFWAKDEILAQAWFRGDYGLWAVGVVAALFTAFYMTRQVWLVFYDRRTVAPIAERRDTKSASRTSRRGSCSSRCSCSPCFALFGGLIDLPFVNVDFDILDRWLEPVFAGVQPEHASSFFQGFALSTVALVVAIIGIVIGRAVYLRGLKADGADPDGRAPRRLRRRAGQRATTSTSVWRASSAGR